MGAPFVGHKIARRCQASREAATEAIGWADSAHVGRPKPPWRFCLVLGYGSFPNGKEIGYRGLAGGKTRCNAGPRRGERRGYPSGCVVCLHVPPSWEKPGAGSLFVL